MNKKIVFFFLLLLLFNFSVYSQMFFVKSGKNYSTYQFKSNYVSSSVSSDVGDSYEFGYFTALDRKYRGRFTEQLFNYEVSITLNDFNALVREPEINIKYNAQYLGIQNVLNYKITGGYRDSFSFNTRGGISVNKMVFGKEESEGKIYPLNSFDEFNKLIVMASLGMNVVFYMSEDIHFNLGYDRHFTLLNLGNDYSLSISSNQFKLGLCFSVD